MKLVLVYIVEPITPCFTFHMCVYMECRVICLLASIEAEAVGISQSFIALWKSRGLRKHLIASKVSQ